MSAPHTITVDGVRYVRAALRVSAHVMYDCHLFRPLGGRTVDDLLADWRRECAAPEERYGRPYLCPVIVLQEERELRRVGPMVFRVADEAGVAAWRSALLDDPDIPALLASGDVVA